MIKKINNQQKNSVINPNYNFSPTLYPRATADGISRLLQIDSNKIDHQHHLQHESKNSDNLDIKSPSTSFNSSSSPIKISSKRKNKPTKLNNNPFGDVLQKKATDVTRILFQNVGGLELSTTGHTLEVTCQSIKQYNIDIACLTETNPNWDHPKAKKQIHKIKKQFCKRRKLTTTMSTVPWKIVHKPGGVSILSTPLISPRIIKEQQDPTGMGRWTSITINGRNKTKVTIISAYRVCLTTIKATGPNTAFCQQWDMLEEKGKKIIVIREKMINDLIILIMKLQVEKHEVVLNIDANESFDSGKGGVVKLISMTKLIDPIACTHGSENIPNTHQ